LYFICTYENVSINNHPVLNYKRCLMLTMNNINMNSSEIDTTALTQFGKIISNKDGIIEIVGLDDVIVGEVLSIGDDSIGLVINIEFQGIKAIILGDDTKIVQDDLATPTGTLLYVPVGENLLGRVVDTLGRPMDGGDALVYEEYNYIEAKAPGIITRKSVHESLATGILAIDSAISIGRGQRELIIGDRQTGKSTLAIDTIINHRGIDAADSDKLYCIYVAVGQRLSSVVNFVDQLKALNAFNHVTVVSATSAEPASLQYLAPYTGCTMGEYFRDNQTHALVVYDDLSKHAVAYRQISLLLRRPPGREAYPGDVFYLHSRLLERAAKLNEDYGAGSLTALPVIETQAGDLTAYIPTNVISITDGQVFLERELFYKGIRPAINIGLSVSRVGSAAQNPLMKEFVGSLKLELAQYREVEIFASFGSEIDITTQQIIKRGARLVELLNQEPYKPLAFEHELTLLFAGRNGYLDSLSITQVDEFKEMIKDLFANEESALALENLYNLDDEIVRDITLDFLMKELVSEIQQG
jgi:F-type H+-transporting ATPase subunit alpha